MTYQQPPQQPPQPPQQPPQYPPQQSYPQQQFSPPPPVEPKKSSKTWLYVIIGIVGLCVLCGIIGAIGMAIGGNVISKNIEQITGQLTVVAPTMESLATSVVIDTPEPQQEATAQPPQSNENSPAPQASGIITGVTMAKGVKGNEMEPENPTDVFAAKDTFHAVTKIEDAPANTTFKATWYAIDVGDAADPNTLIDSTEITSDGSRYLDFNLTPNSGWPSGTYKVEIYVNGTLDQVVDFSVE